MEPSSLSSDRVLAELARVNTSKTFQRAGRHRTLLRHLVERTATGRAAEIKESTIALEVFGKDSYDPQIDSQVRVEISQLRERLDKYYATEGGRDPLRIEIPKGSYEPAFREPNTQPVLPGTAGPLTPVALPKRVMVTWGLALLVIATVVTGLIWRPIGSPKFTSKPSIAILPFEDLSPAKDQDYFCSGVTEELTNDLIRLDLFRVLPRSSVARYKTRPTDAREIGKQLGVEAVMEGTVRKENNRVRVSVHLVDTRQGVQLWTNTYEGDLSHILETQRKIADSVADSFHMELKSTRRALIRQRTRNPDAYDLYLKAAYLFGNDVERSIEVYRAAVQADPGYALAWAGLAGAWNRMVDWQVVSPAKARGEALAAASKAMELDPALGEAHRAWGVAKLYYERDWRAAEQALLKATELDPMFDDARWEYARLILIPTRRFKESAEILQAGISLEPFSVPLYDVLANTYIKAGQYREAIPHVAAARKISAKLPAPIVLEGMIAAGLGNFPEAVQKFEEAAKIRRSNWVLGHLGFALAKLGRTAEARAVIAELEQRGAAGLVPDVDIAVIHAGLGDKNRAMAALERALAGFSHSLLWINVDYASRIGGAIRASRRC